jgi:tRNA(fMet)-specific endonuclease VapC
MKRYLLDTNAVSDLINHRHAIPARVREARVRGVVIGTCEPVVAELFFGVENSETRDENRRRLRHGLRRLRCWPLDRRASEEFGRLVAELKRAGRLIGPMDMLIAAIALSLGDCTVVTCDKDLLSVPGLKVENWRTADEEGTA